MSLIVFSESERLQSRADLEVPGDVRALRLAPDGKRVAVVSVPRAGEAAVLVLDADHPAPTWRTCLKGRRCGGIAWSADGLLLAVELDGALYVAPADAAAGSVAELPGPASSLAWLGREAVVLGFPLIWPPGAVFGADGMPRRTLEPPHREVSTHAPKVATSPASSLVAFSHTWRSVMVFDEGGGVQELKAEADGGDEPRLALTHRLELSFDGTEVATMAQPSPGDARTDVWTGVVRDGTLRRTLRLPPSAVVALAPDFRACWSSPLNGGSVDLWTTKGYERSVGTASDRLWGLVVTGTRICAWSRRAVSLYESDSSPWGRDVAA